MCVRVAMHPLRSRCWDKLRGMGRSTRAPWLVLNPAVSESTCYRKCTCNQYPICYLRITVLLGYGHTPITRAMFNITAPLHACAAAHSNLCALHRSARLCHSHTRGTGCLCVVLSACRNDVMVNSMRTLSPWASLYFVCVILIGNYLGGQGNCEHCASCAGGTVDGVAASTG